MSTGTESSTAMLSVLIPAYNYAQGVRRILLPILAENRRDVEILIHDDSTEGEVEQFAAPLTAQHRDLHYKRNTPALGAVENWNGLLASARGRYVILIHHDDFPLSERFAADVIEELKHKGWPDVLLLTCIAYDQERQRVKPNVCSGVRRWVARAWPAYLLRRNVIGPPSAVVLRRDVAKTYDPMLTWLVDVEAYSRILSEGKRSIAASHQVMISSTGRRDSITHSIQRESARVTARELAYIARKGSGCRRKQILVSQALSARVAMRLEWIVWGGLKAVSALCRTIKGSQPSLKDIEQRQAVTADYR